MMKNNTNASSHTSLAVITTLSALLMPVSASAWDSLTVFGDSLSDGGNIGRYTWDGATHPLYDEILAQNMGQTLLPSSQGKQLRRWRRGSDAFTESGSQYARSGFCLVYRHGGRADSNGLYIHWIGGNDLAAAVISPLFATEIVDNSATAAAAQVKTLLDAGAGAVIVPTVPDVGATPAVTEAILSLLGPAAEPALAAAFQSLDSAVTPDAASRQQAIETALTQAASEISSIPAVRDALAQQLIAAWQTISDQAATLTDRYNQLEESGLVATRGNIVRVDVNGLFSEVIANPALYGISNTAGMACPTGVSASVCTSSTPGFSSAQSYLFADRLHPSPAVHALIADYIQSVLDAPLQVAALTQSPLAMVRDVHNTLDGHLQQQRHRPASAGQLTVFGGYAGQHSNSKGDAWNDGDATTTNLALGLGYQVTENWQAGALLLLRISTSSPHPVTITAYVVTWWRCGAS
ncbi:SGNH/GDSL hydrolase family protein [Pantoea sp. LMR881]|uniref:SGNH/GDSL hydrolase family protein n=1 Tax=Pantoea sp. LMR881 TaxID=3014336 RepID=UPI0022AFD2B6|nr:SGNH/GDSL hydrolase family protein [Pantoea sp. LMR881]MCZ4061470.1 SGNH/GDSL hydrolase family protein [Pantoea sp. LMR881]